MAIYLVDYENVYIEGLEGLESLAKQDEVVIFYTQNRCGLTFELHRRLISCKASLRLMEVTALSTRKNTVKNALDLQLSMYMGYLIGRCPHEPLYIISKDTDFDLNLSFFKQYLQEGDVSLAICATIEDALHGVEAIRPEQLLEAAESSAAETLEEDSESTGKKQTKKNHKNTSAAVFPKMLQLRVKQLLETEDAQMVNRICAMLMASEDLLTLNNLLSRYYHDGKQVKQMYHKLKPAFGALREAATSGEEA